MPANGKGLQKPPPLPARPLALPVRLAAVQVAAVRKAPLREAAVRPCSGRPSFPGFLSSQLRVKSGFL